jgi:RNA polymerase sigma factor (sigma-70 family)
MAHGQSEAVLKPPQEFRHAEAVAEATDGHLLARFAACRDAFAEIAFETLVRRHGPMVLRVCHQVLGDRHNAEDAFQATFLILARRAGSIRQPELLGNWLHGVALRTAREARMRDDRRRRREGQGRQIFEEIPAGESPRPEQALFTREALETLHEEVWRLPERYRIPVVLCDLEGLTHQEAAQRLRCPPGTIGVRLRRARERLRVRLTGRGFAPTAGLLGVLLRGDDAATAMPSVLIASTVKAAMGCGSSPGTIGGLVPPAVATLAERVLRAMARTRLKAAVGLALAVGVAATLWSAGPGDSGIVVAHEPRQIQPAEEATPVDRPALPEPDAPGPGTDPTPPARPSGLALADRSGPKPADMPPIEASRSIPEVRPEAGHNREEVKDSLGKDPTSALALAPARVRRPPPEEPARGEALFAKEWLPDDPRGHGGDGLGPLYNDTSCVACHSLGAPGGAGPETKNVFLVTATPSGCGPSSGLSQVLPGLRNSRSAVVHHFSTDPGYTAWRSRLFNPQANGQTKAASNRGEDPVASRISALREQTSPDGRMRSRSPRGASSMNGFNLTLVERNTPPLFGLGQVDAIPSEVLVAAADNQPRDVQGRVGRTREGRIGRFGWKAQIPSLHEFVRVACANELGLEVPGHPQATSPLSPGSKAKGLDLTEAECDALVSYVRTLPTPVVVDPDGPQGNRDLREGRRLFDEIGCATCHAPTLGEVKGIYSDLLLHDMGQSLSDSGSSYGIDGPDTPSAPKPREWRTPPLWGYRDSGPYLHDGRAQGLEEAVALHDGQARSSAHRFFSLSWRERAQVEAFLKSLVAPSAAAAPGLMLAADLESRLHREQQTAPESTLRQQRQEAVARDEQAWQEARRRERAQAAAKRARAKIPLAQSLERMGKTAGAINFYREIARDAAGTDEGRLATERINMLSTRVISP